MDGIAGDVLVDLESAAAEEVQHGAIFDQHPRGKSEQALLLRQLGQTVEDFAADTLVLEVVADHQPDLSHVFALLDAVLAETPLMP